MVGRVNVCGKVWQEVKSLGAEVKGGRSIGFGSVVGDVGGVKCRCR